MKERGVVNLDIEIRQVVANRRWRILATHPTNPVWKLVLKEFHANLIDQVALTCRVRDILVPFNRDVTTTVLGLKHEDNDEWKALQAKPHVDDITYFLIRGRATW